MPVVHLYTYDEFKAVISEGKASLFVFTHSEDDDIATLIQSHAMPERVHVVPVSRLPALAVMHNTWTVPEVLSLAKDGRVVARSALLNRGFDHCAVNAVRVQAVGGAAKVGCCDGTLN